VSELTEGGHASNAGPRSTVRRHPERAAPELVEAILCAGRVAHVAFALEGQPYVLPFAYHYERDAVYLHGAPVGRAMRALCSGTPVCVEVLLLDGLVASRDAQNHSINYRSAVVFGCAEEVADLAEKRAIFAAMTERYFARRTEGRDYAPARNGQLVGTALFRVCLKEASGQRRAGPPLGPHDSDDGHSTGSAFVVELPGLDS
jgi:nitroimidazol reductase NimA-like FMN-containing flavoprotein (pyridoxamine 5'-phosphate oxidase superfamily)